MRSDKVNKCANFNLNLIGIKNLIDISTLLTLLNQIQTLTKDIGSHFSRNTQDIELKINFIDGKDYSIVFLLESKKEHQELFNSNKNLLNDLCLLIILFLHIYKFKKGMKLDLKKKNDLKFIEDFALINNIAYISQKLIEELYNNILIREHISKIIECISNDDNVMALEVLCSSASVSVSKEEMPELVYEDFGEEDASNKDIRYTVDDKAILSIVTLSFEKRKKWQFYYKGHRISVSMKNEAFMFLLNNGLSISKGDKLEVVLKIQQVYDNKVNDFVNKKYEIEEFLNYIRVPRQISFMDHE